MAKQITGTIKLQIPGGQATLVPPVGPALGQAGVSPGEFISKFNQATRELNGTIVPVVVTVYRDKTFDFIVKKPPAAVLLKQAAGIAKGSGTAGRELIAQVSTEQVREIARTKMPDLGVDDLERAMRIIAGTARSMGIRIVDAQEQEQDDKP